MGLDFKELHKPYACEDSPNPEGQLKWLLKNGIPQDIAARAMVQVYTEIEQGKQFKAEGKYSAGWILDNYILDVAKKLNYKVTEAYLKSLEEEDMKQRERIKKELLDKQPKTLGQRIKSVFKNPYR